LSYCAPASTRPARKAATPKLPRQQHVLWLPASGRQAGHEAPRGQSGQQMGHACATIRHSRPKHASFQPQSSKNPSLFKSILHMGFTLRLPCPKSFRQPPTFPCNALAPQSGPRELRGQQGRGPGCAQAALLRSPRQAQRRQPSQVLSHGRSAANAMIIAEGCECERECVCRRADGRQERSRERRWGTRP
jgi:hypothetical protein